GSAWRLKGRMRSVAGIQLMGGVSIVGSGWPGVEVSLAAVAQGWGRGGIFGVDCAPEATTEERSLGGPRRARSRRSPTLLARVGGRTGSRPGTASAAAVTASAAADARINSRCIVTSYPEGS